MLGYRETDGARVCKQDIRYIMLDDRSWPIPALAPGKFIGG